MKFPIKMCGTWTLFFSNNPSYQSTNIKFDVNYEKITYYKELHPIIFFGIEQQKTGFVTKFKENPNTAHVVWNKYKGIKLKTPIFPSVEIPWNSNKLQGQRIIYDIDDDFRWITLKTGDYEYTFRKTQLNACEDFPSFHKLLITQLILTEIINNIIYESKNFNLQDVSTNILSGISRIHIL